MNRVWNWAQTPDGHSRIPSVTIHYTFNITGASFHYKKRIYEPSITVYFTPVFLKQVRLGILLLLRKRKWLGEHKGWCLCSNGVKYGKVVVKRQIATSVRMWPLTSVNEPVYDIMLAVSLLIILAAQPVMYVLVNVGEKDEVHRDRMCLRQWRNKIFTNGGFCWTSVELFTLRNKTKCRWAAAKITEEFG